jgi:hypothetical protein
MMGAMKKLFSLIALALLSTTSFAGIFKIENRSFTNPAFAAEGNSLLDQLENEINKNFPQVDAEGYLRASGNASVSAGAGLGVDYSTDFTLAMVGLQGAVGVNPGKTSFNKALKEENADKIKGIGVQGALMGGFNLDSLPGESLGFIPTANSRAFFHLLPYKRKFKEVSVRIFDVGAHYQHRFLPGVGLGLVRWDGLSFTTGLKYSRTKITYQKAVSQSAAVNVGGTPTTAAFAGTLDSEATMNIWTIPLEVSSAVRLLYFLQIYGGLGSDLSFGSSKGGAVLNNATFTTSPSIASGTPTASLGAKKGPNILNARYFVGLGFEALVASVYAQFTQTVTNKTYGLQMGVKGYW